MDVLTGIVAVAGHPEHWGGGWWIARIVMFVFWIVVIALLFRFVIRPWRWGYREPSPLDRARGILAERYARGEIDAEEYRQRLDQLR